MYSLCQIVAKTVIGFWYGNFQLRLQNSCIFCKHERRSIFERKVWSEYKNSKGEWKEILKSMTYEKSDSRFPLHTSSCTLHALYAHYQIKQSLGSSPGQGRCVVFIGKTFYSHSASLHLCVCYT